MSTKQLAVVSGGTRGIGLGISRRLLEMGHSVVALYRDDDTAAAEAEKELGPGLAALRCDVADQSQVDAVVTRIVTDFGAPRVLVNNAGINVERDFLDMTGDDFRRVVDVNLVGPFQLSRAVVPHMAATDPVIVNVGATTGIRPRRGGVNYCVSKAGLLHMTKCLALELAPRIRVNSLIPGVIETEEVVNRFDLRDESARDRMLAEIPQGRTGQVAEIADALEFLVSSRGSYVNGQKLIVDGGQFMW